MKKILALLILTIATVSPVFATNWVKMNDKFYMDTDTIKPYVDDSGHVKPNQYSVWVKVLNTGNESWRELEKTSHKKIWYSLYKNVVDVNKNVIAWKSSIDYDLNGNRVDSTSMPDKSLEWKSVVPNQISDYEIRIIKLVISGKWH